MQKGLEFNSKKEVQSSVKMWSINNNVSYQVVESKPTYWVVKCTEADAGCGWWLRATKKRSSMIWSISVYKGSHTCSAPLMSQDHR